MKRFFIIFVICFASLIGVFAGVFGIKYLKGDFNPVIINPEDISFNSDIYEEVDDFWVTITTTTEGVTITNVNLSFAKGIKTNTYGEGYITDGVIVIPKQAKIGIPFKVELRKTDDAEADGLPWIKGGISNIVAKSECETTPQDTATIYVDVPVYKTELVVFAGDGQVEATSSYTSALKYIEGQSALTKPTQKALNAGDTFYVGIKYYPERSAYKYSKMSSSNVLVAYNEQILAKLEELDLTQEYASKFETLNDLFTVDQTAKTISIEELMQAYLDIVDLSKASNATKVGQFNQFLQTLIQEQFEKNLKYYTFEESASNERTYLTKLSRVNGTNLYKVQATTDSILLQSGATANIYAYTFTNSKLEQSTFNAVGNNYINLLSTLENLYTENGLGVANKKVDKPQLAINIVDVDVDKITINGEIEDFSISKVHTIYLAKQGTNTATTSYLGLNLSNSNVPAVNLQNKLSNVGIRFEKRRSTNEWETADEIKFVDSENYTQVTYDGKTYYLPLGSAVGYMNTYWQIYSDTYLAIDTRAVIVCFKGDLTGEILSDQVVLSQDSPVFKLTDPSQNEKTVQWTDTTPLTLNIVNITDTIDMSVVETTSGEESLKNVSYNTEIDLSNYVNIPVENFYRTYKFFLYSDDTEQETGDPISNYFYVVGNSSKQYQFYGATKNLYELDGNILKLKSSEWPENYSVKVIFATIKTDALRQPILTPVYGEDGETILDYHYTFAKYSAVEDNYVKNLSAITINFVGSIKTLSGVVSNALRENSIKDDVAGKAQDGLFKVAQKANNALIVTVQNNGDDATLVKSAIDNGDLRIEARAGKSGANNFITFTTEYLAGENYFLISTNGNLEEDVLVRLYLVYNVDGEEYLFPVVINDTAVGNAGTYHELTIVKDTSAVANFNFFTASGVVSVDEISYIKVVTDYEKNPDNSPNTSKFKKSYYAYFKDTTKEMVEINIIDTTSNKILVEVIDFLGNTSSKITNWYLTSSNQSVVTISDNQKLNFIGVCDEINPVTISLFIASGVLQQTVNFVVNETGYASKVVANQDTINEFVIFDEEVDKNKIYNFTKQTIAVNVNTSEVFQIDNVLRIFYKLNQEQEIANQLPMLVYLANADSLKRLQKISSETDFVNKLVDKADSEFHFEKNNITTIKLSKDLGTVVSIELLFVCQELGITQEVTLKFNQNISITDVSITNVATGNNVVVGASVYQIYAGIDYKVEITSNATKLLWYYDGQTENFNEINEYSFIFYLQDGSLSQQKIHITNVADGLPTDGDLNYILEFNVQNNIMLKHQTKQQKSLTGNKLTLEFTEIFERRTALTQQQMLEGGYTINPNLATYCMLGEITFDFDTKYASDNAKINTIEDVVTNVTISPETKQLIITFKEFRDKLDIVIYIKCNGEIVGDALKLTIIPQNQLRPENPETKRIVTNYNGEKAIVVSNGQTVKSTSTNLFSSLFNEGTVVDCDSTFYDTYTTTDSGITKVVFSGNTLFENTGKYVSVTKEGISTYYVVIISKLAFPFVEFTNNDAETINYNDVDIYNLFVETSNLLEYYQNNDIASFIPTVPEDETEAKLLLVNTESDTNAVFKLKPITGAIYNKVNFNSVLGSIEVLQGSLSANSYASINAVTADNENGSIYLNVNPVGEDVYLKVVMYILPNGSMTYYEIPVVVKLEVSQILHINYAFSGKQDSSANPYYGSDNYDKKIMLENASTFEEDFKYMEYLSFDINGKASLDLINKNYNRFVVYKGATLDTNYDDGFKFEIVKVSKNYSGVWSYIDTAQMLKYANFENNMLTSTSGLITINNVGDGTAYRVKIKVTTSGGAVSYYYLSVGEQIPMTLNRQKDTTNVSVGSYDMITVSANDVLLIGGGKEGDYAYATVSPMYYYYITNATYNKELQFRLFDSDGNAVYNSEEIAKYILIDKNKLTIKVQPVGANFKIQIYTSYGELTMVNITVKQSVNINLTNNTIYSGTKYSSYSDIINATPASGAESIGRIQIMSVQKVGASLSNNLFECSDGFVFAHIPAGQTKTFDMCLAIEIKINTDTFTVQHTFNSVSVTPRIVAKTFDNGFYRDDTATELTTYVESDGYIDISNNLWGQMFEDQKRKVDNPTSSGIDLANEDNLKFFIEGVDCTANVKNTSIQWTITNALIDEDIRNWSFVIKDISGQVLAQSYAKITIKPQYDVAINYPTVVDSTSENVVLLNCEYVQNGSEVDFSTANFASSLARIVVQKANSGTYSEYNDYVIVYEGAGGIYNDKVALSDKRVSFSFDASDFNNKTEIECRFDVVIGEKTYATYVVKVLKDSPFSLDADYLDNITFGYGSESTDLFKTVDVYVTLPGGFTLGQKVDLYVGNGIKIAQSIYYKEGDIYHALLKVTDYQKDLKVYICLADSMVVGSDAECTKVEFKVRATLKYQGYQVQYKHYDSVMGDAELTQIAGTPVNNVYSYSAKVAKGSNLSIVSSDNVVEGVYVDYIFDISIDDSHTTQDKALILNANEVENGQSFVTLFGVKDAMGNKFWYNQLGNTKNTTLRVRDIGGSIECLPVYPQTIEETFVFDYLMKPLGAKNDGTLCELTFKYTYDDKIYEKVLYVKVISDIEFEVYNNDGTTTPNSKSNPLKINSGADDILFVSAAQTKYIYAYSKYAKEPTNLAQQLILTVEKLTESATDFITIRKQTSPLSLMIDVMKDAEFGNKTIHITLKDNYGYKIDYYIELVASINVTSYTVDAGKVFEGKSISVYNKNKADGKETTGAVAVTLNKGADKDTSTDIIIYEASFWYKGKTEYNSSVINNVTASKISFKFLPDTIWDTSKNNGISNGLSFTGSLHIVIGINTSSTERYSFDVDFTIYKKYKFDLSAENTFIREDVDVNLAHFIDVYDYSQDTYLGKPEIEENEQLKIKLTLNQNGSETVSGATQDLLASSSKLLYTHITEAINEFNGSTTIREQEQALSKLSKYGIWPNSYTDGGVITITSGTDVKAMFESGLYNGYLLVNKQNKYCIYDVSGNLIVLPDEITSDYKMYDANGNEVMKKTLAFENLNVYLNIEAVHKTNNSKTSSLVFSTIEKVDGKYSINYRLKLGANSDKFSAGVTTQDYYFNVWLCDITDSAIRNKTRVATTIAGDLGASNAVNNQQLTAIQTSTLYQVSITNGNSSTSSGEGASSDEQISLAFTVGNNNNVVYVINSYFTSDSEQTSNINAGKHDFDLFNGTYTGLKYEMVDGSWLHTAGSFSVDFEGNTVSLFTGKINTITYVNGLSDVDVLKAKNILKATYIVEGETRSSDLSYRGSLVGSTFDYNSKNQIHYQTRTIKDVEILYKDYGNDEENPVNANAKEKKDLQVYLTLKYTGVNSENAYVGSTIHYVYLNNLGTSAIDENGAVASTVTVAFNSTDDNYWAKGFELKTGVGVANILAMSEDKTFVGSNDEVANVNSLSFEVGRLIGASGDVITSSLFDIDSVSGAITLKQGFILNSYYVSIIIKCKYQGSTEPKQIGEVYLAFVNVLSMDIYGIGNNKFKLNISQLVETGTTITAEQVKLEGSVTSSVYKNGEDWYAEFDNANGTIQDGQFMLTVGDTSRYVYLTKHEISVAGGEINLYKIDSTNYAFYGDNILICSNNETLSANEKHSLGEEISAITIYTSDWTEIANGSYQSGDGIYLFTSLSTTITSGGKYYIGSDNSYCEVIINTVNRYIDGLSLTIDATNGNYFDLTDKKLHSASSSDQDLYNLLNNGCTSIKIGENIVEITTIGDKKVISFAGTLETNYNVFSFIDKDGDLQQYLVYISH